MRCTTAMTCSSCSTSTRTIFSPLLAQDYIMRKKLARGTTVAWYDAVGQHHQPRTVMLDYDAATSTVRC